MNEENNGCILIVALALIVGIILVCAIVFPGNMTNIVKIEHRPIIRVDPVPAATATPDIYFETILAVAKAAATAEIIKAEANARSQAVNDEIRLAKEKHNMRRFWAWLAIPTVAIFGGIAAYLYFWKVYRVE